MTDSPSPTSTLQLHLQTVPARHGMLWIRHGFKIVRRQPMGMLRLYALVFMLGSVVSVLIPFAGLLMMMVMPLVSLAFMLATHQVLQNRAPTLAVFREPLRLTPARRKSQLQLGLVYGVLICLAVMAAEQIIGSSAEHLRDLMSQANPDEQAVVDAMGDPRLLGGYAFAMAAMALISVPFWHASALVHWSGQGTLQAMFSSTLAVWRNKAAFTLYGLGWLGLVFATSFVISLALGLGLPAPAMLVLAAPLSLFGATGFYASLYFTFVDCFMFGAPKELPSS